MIVKICVFQNNLRDLKNLAGVVCCFLLENKNTTTQTKTLSRGITSISTYKSHKGHGNGSKMGFYLMAYYAVAWCPKMSRNMESLFQRDNL
ncbi:MAG: hypothetical protein PHF08_03670 [Candidatus Riflebacteria bacterium]|nr:hypothetical protein [Candidatus Riflebacteria bacterium]